MSDPDSGCESRPPATEAAPEAQPREPYVRPTVTDLGRLSTLFRGSGAVGFDAMTGQGCTMGEFC